MKPGLLVAALMALTASHALPQGITFGYRYTFPRFEIPGTELLIANVNNTDGIVQTAFYNADGSTASSSQFSLGAGAQRIFADADASLTSFIGVVVLQSTTPLSVTASFSSSTGLENSAPATPGTDLVIPFVRAGAIADTQVSIFNPGTMNADVILILGKSDGTQVEGSRITLTPNQSAQISLNQLGTAGLDSVTHVFIRSATSVFSSDKSVFASATIRNFNNGTGVVRQDTAVVQAVPADNAASNVTMPLFVQGSGYSTLLQVVNLSNITQSVTLTALGTDGSPVSSANNPFTKTIPAGGAFSEDLLAIFGFTSDIMGSISINGGGALTAVSLLGNDNSPSLGVIPAAGTALSTIALQFRSISRDFFDGLSFLNTNSGDAQLSLTFINNDGSTSSSAQLLVPAGNQVVKPLSDVLPEASGSGFIFISSTGPILTATLEGSTNVLSQVPVSAVAPGFNPQPQSKFLAVGKATISGVPLPGASVSLSGTVSGTQTTDSTGTYVFRDLPPGTYTVTIQLAGVQFTPSSIPFVIQTENSRDDNFEGTILAATLTSITPGSVLAGSQSVQITAKGGPFIPTSQIVFDGAIIPTSFLDETTLTGVVGSSALLLPRQVAVQVRNSVGSNFSPTGTQNFVVGTSAPVITALEGVPNQIIAGNPGFTVTVDGSGFNAGGTVEIDGVPRPYVFDSTTKVDALIGPADLAVGRIAKLTATNPGTTVGPSNALPITVNNPVAGVTSISPNQTTIKIEPNSTGLQLTVNGYLFKPGATVQVQNFPALSTAFVDSTQLIANIPADALQVGGVFAVTVSNPQPNIGASEAQPLIVYDLVPQLLSVDVGNLTYAAGTINPVPLQAIAVLHGSNFGTTYTAAVLSPPACTTAASSSSGSGGSSSSGSGSSSVFVQAPVTHVSSTELIAQLTILCTGTYQIYVSSNQSEPGGGTSQTLSFTVASPPTGTTPVLSSLAPPSTSAGAAVTLTINGSNFLAGALVNFGTAILTPVSVTSTAVVVNIPAYLLQQTGLIPVTVTNPGVGGTGAGSSTSARFLFQVTQAVPPVITSLFPPVTPALSPDFALMITGTGFESGAVVNFGGFVLMPTSVTATSITVTVPASLVNQRGLVPIVVTNPDVTGSSNSVIFGVN